jgi:hypothetical protein
MQPAGLSQVPLQAVDGPVFGASLIGVASKVKQNSLLVYQGKDTYFEWEFIWNPLLNGGPGGTQQAPGAVPAGAAPSGAGQASEGAGAGGGVGAGAGAGNLPPLGTPGVGAQRGPGRGGLPMPGMPGVGRQ